MSQPDPTNEIFGRPVANLSMPISRIDRLPNQTKNVWAPLSQKQWLKPADVFRQDGFGYLPQEDPAQILDIDTFNYLSKVKASLAGKREGVKEKQKTRKRTNLRCKSE